MTDYLFLQTFVMHNNLHLRTYLLSHAVNNDIDINDSLNIRPASRTRGHDYKLYKTHTAGTRRSFFQWACYKCLEWFAYRGWFQDFSCIQAHYK